MVSVLLRLEHLKKAERTPPDSVGGACREVPGLGQAKFASLLTPGEGTACKFPREPGNGFPDCLTSDFKLRDGWCKDLLESCPL